MMKALTLIQMAGNPITTFMFGYNLLGACGIILMIYINSTSCYIDDIDF